MARKKRSVKQIEESIETLSNKLFERLKEFRDSGTKFCIIDRFNGYDFFEVFKDALYSYRSDAVICERLYYEKKCYLAKRKTFDISDDAKKLYESFIKFSKKIEKENISELSDEEVKQRENKIEDYKKKLEDNPPEEKDISLLSYKTDFNGEGYLVTELNKISDEILLQISKTTVNFVFSYFSTFKYMAMDGYSISITPIFSEDYIDIIAIMKEM